MLPLKSPNCRTKMFQGSAGSVTGPLRSYTIVKRIPQAARKDAVSKIMKGRGCALVARSPSLRTGLAHRLWDHCVFVSVPSALLCGVCPQLTCLKYTLSSIHPSSLKTTLNQKLCIPCTANLWEWLMPWLFPNPFHVELEPHRWPELLSHGTPCHWFSHDTRVK